MSELKKTTLGEITVNLNKLRIPLSANERSKLDKIYPYYGAQNIVDYVDKYIFDGEYILVAEDGENLRSQNQNVCNFVSGKFWVNNHAHILQAKDNHNLRYIYYKLNLINYSRYITGSAQPKLTQDNLCKIELSIHSADEQINIASVLHALDYKIRHNNKINDNLVRIAKTIYDYWFTQFEFPDSQGRPYKSSGGKMVWNEDLKKEIPEGWAVKNLASLTNLIVRGISPKYTNDQGICVLNQKCIRDNKVLFEFSRRHNNETKGAEAKQVMMYDVLVNSTGVGTLGRVALIKRLPENFVVVDSHVTIVRANYKEINPLYFGFSLMQKQKEIEEFSVGSTGQVELNRNQLESVRLLVPSQNIQVSFQEVYFGFLEKMSICEVETESLSSLRDWLLPILMNGQVKVK